MQATIEELYEKHVGLCQQRVCMEKELKTMKAQHEVLMRTLKNDTAGMGMSIAARAKYINDGCARVRERISQTEKAIVEHDKKIRSAWYDYREVS